MASERESFGEGAILRYTIRRIEYAQPRTIKHGRDRQFCGVIPQIMK